jgi:ligand-binding SRPBCC domain-containing protein
MYRLERNIIIDIDPIVLWDFIATPRNLDQITPPELKFKILSNVPDVMYDGLQIRYEITIPLFGRRQWLTEISEIVTGESFVDMQVKGPYTHWRHFHQLLPTGNNASCMIDRIDYELPFGLVGNITHSLLVKNQLEAIFDYREQALRRIFFPAE